MAPYDKLIEAIAAAPRILAQLEPSIYLRCGCFYRLPGTPHRPGWRYRCWKHRILAALRLIERGPDGGL